MSYENNQFKELINDAIHNHFHDDTEKEMMLKDWLYGICEQLDEYEQHKVATTILVNTLKSKADEYEAKAKAFEKVAGIAHWYFERVNPEYADFSDYEGFYDDIKDEFKRFESGESDAKK